MYVRERPCLEPGHGGCYPLPEPALEEGVVVAELWVAVAGEDLHAALVTPRPLLVTPGPALAPPTRHTQTGLSNTSNWDIFCHLLEERGKKWGNGGEDKTYFIQCRSAFMFCGSGNTFFYFYDHNLKQEGKRRRRTDSETLQCRGVKFSFRQVPCAL